MSNGRRHLRAVIVLAALLALQATGARGFAQSARQPDWAAVQEETLRHYLSILQLDTRNPPGSEHLVADYLKQVLDREGIPAETFALDSDRSNLVARLKGNGRKRPLLLMGHEDVVTVDAAKWTHPPFSATREGGYVYGRGTIDDKDSVATFLMTMLLLKRLNVSLDRDVIFLAESGEEGTTSFGIQLMVNQHFQEIDAEFCLAEGGGVTRVNGQARYAEVQTLEETPRRIELVATGIAGHGSIPLQSNAIVHLAGAVARIGAWRPDVRFNETTATYFRRLSTISPPEVAKYYSDILSPDPAVRAAADDWLFVNQPRLSSMLRTSVSPNIFEGGYRSNVIPSEARATLDVRMLPDEDHDRFLAQVKAIVNDPAVEARFPAQDVRPAGGDVRLDSEAFRAIEAAVTRVYNTVTLPTMGTGATDMSYLRAKGVQCYGIGPAIDLEDGPKGFGAHSDQERLLESELHRYVRLAWDVVTNLAAARP